MRVACAECGSRVGHDEDCTADPPPQHNRGNPLLIDAIIQSDHHQTWTA